MFFFQKNPLLDLKRLYYAACHALRCEGAAGQKQKTRETGNSENFGN